MLNFDVFFERGKRPSEPLIGNGFFLTGSRSCGKTSLAFQAVVNTVLDGGSVVVLCSESSIYAKVPQPFVSLSSLSDEALQRIEFIYITMWREALEELMTFGLSTNVPSLIVIDDDEFTDTIEETHSRTSSSLGSGAVPSCLSYLENMKDWLSRNNTPFFYILVSNSVCTDCVHSLPLPYAVFPVVHLWIGASGTVWVTPTPQDPLRIAPLTLKWNNGLTL